MSTQSGIRERILTVILLPVLGLAAGCHSYHVETTVENRTGAAIQLLEIDYPSASFGANSVAAGAIFHYRIQLRGSGPGAVHGRRRKFRTDGRAYALRATAGQAGNRAVTRRQRRVPSPAHSKPLIRTN